MTGDSHQAANDTDITEEAVADYLRDHPGFLGDNPEVLKALTPPGRWSGDGVVDMQQFMLEQLRNETDNMREAARHVIETSRSNMAVQTRVHTAVLVLLGARTFDDLAHMVHHDLPLPLDVDTVVMAFEPGERPVPELVDANVGRLEPGAVDALLGDDRDARLFPEFDDPGGALFGEAAPLVRSAAIARLRPGYGVPTGVVAWGSRGSAAYQPGQGTELLVFLARVIERLAHRFLEAAD